MNIKNRIICKVCLVYKRNIILYGYDFKRKLLWSEECEKVLFFVLIIVIIIIFNIVFFL